MSPERARDVCLLLEGTYPFVPGGVSTWVHKIVGELKDVEFAILHLGPRPGVYGPPRYQLPPNVRTLVEAYFHDPAEAPRPVAARRRRPSRTLDAIRRLHLGEPATDTLVNDLAAADLSIPELIHGPEAFEVFCELERRLVPDVPFVELFWHLRGMYVPLLRVLGTPVPEASLYHAICTGYAGVLGAVASARTGRPLILTEHGLYSRERDVELARSTFIVDEPAAAADSMLPAAAPGTPSPLRALWSRFFYGLGRVAYHQATQIVALSDGARRRQIVDGAGATRTRVIPNGVDTAPRAHTVRPSGLPLRVGFVGRVVHIKDVITFVRACELALRSVPLDARVIGPEDEAPAYAHRCRELSRALGIDDRVQFVGPLPPARLYADLDVVVLTSLCEGQPLVILEAYAASLPVVATDVGACREMILGRTDDDRRLGASGFITPIASPAATAAAIVALARDAALRRRMAAAGRARVTSFYRDRDMVARYGALYREAVAARSAEGGLGGLCSTGGRLLSSRPVN